MTVRSDPVARRALTLPRPPAWLFGWWLTGRLVVLAAAFAVRPSIWMLDRWDGRWYRMVARGGYLLVPGRQSDPAFLPLYPILLRALHALGVGWGIVGPLVSNLALLAGLALFHALSRELFGAEIARRATTYLAIFPLAYVFSMTYPESIVLLLLAAASLSALRRRWWLATACAAAAALSRPEGIFLTLPLAGIAWQQRRVLDPWRRGAAIAAVLAAPAALTAYPLYLATVLRDPLAWTQAEHGWGRRFRITGLFTAFARLPEAISHQPWALRDVMFFFLYLALLYAAWRLGTPKLWLAAAAGIIILPVFSGTFESIGRFGLLALPVFWGLASLTRSGRADRVVKAVSLLLLVLGTLSLISVVP